MTRAPTARIRWCRNGEALEKGEFNIHATLTIPKGKFHRRFANVPDLDSLAKNEKERQLITLFRNFLYPRWPYVLPPGTPDEIVKTLRGQIVQGSGIPERVQELMGSDPTPLTGEEVETAINEIPRDPETIALYKQMAQNVPLPSR